jgi:hypothetical protein
MPRLISYRTAAALLECSIGHIGALARAAELKDQPIDHVPVRLRRYLGYGFPRPLRLGEKMRRIDLNELTEWMESR